MQVGHGSVAEPPGMRWAATAKDRLGPVSGEQAQELHSLGAELAANVDADNDEAEPRQRRHDRGIEGECGYILVL